MMAYQKERSGTVAQMLKNRARPNRCQNCGYGLGQFGVKFGDEYCSLDCFTTAKVGSNSTTYVSDERSLQTRSYMLVRSNMYPFLEERMAGMRPQKG